MMKVETAPRIDNLIAEMCKLSEEEQRTLAVEVLENRRLEAFVEELDDHLTCERAATEGSAKPFTGD